MIIGSISENKDIEKRISITPDLIKKYISQGLKVFIEKNYGDHLGFSNLYMLTLFHPNLFFLTKK